MTRQPSSLDVQLTLPEPDGRSLTLRASARAQASLQDHYGLDSLKAVAEKLAEVYSNEQIGVPDVVALVYAALRTHHREITEDQVLDMLDDWGNEVMLPPVLEAFEAAMPAGAERAESGEGSAAGDPPKPGPSTGSSKKRPRSD